MAVNRLVAFIPAREGSEGLSRKNVRHIIGRPLYQYSVDIALEAGIDSVIISTNIEEILSAQHKPNVNTIRRPKDLAANDTKMEEVLNHFATNYLQGDEIIILLQPTSPLRSADSIRKSISLYKNGLYSMVMTVCQVDRSILKYGIQHDGRFIPVSDPKYCFSNRQSLPPVYRPNGAVYVFPAKTFQTNLTFPTECIGMIEMDKEESIDIDDLDDLQLCEKILAGENR